MMFAGYIQMDSCWSGVDLAPVICTDNSRGDLYLDFETKSPEKVCWCMYGNTKAEYA